MEWYKFNINDFDKSDYEKFFSLLSDEKRKRVEKMRKTEDKKLSVCGEMLAKCAIAKMCGIAANDIVFKTRKNGKPYCENAEFSISHSGDFAVCAVSDKPIGIDIQKITSYNERVAKKVCSEEEISDIEKSNDKAREFIKLWTKKEAVLKRDGKSIFSRDIKTCLFGNSVKTFEFSGYFVSIAE